MAPELIKKVKYNNKVDVWAIGVITYELLSGSVPFSGETEKEIHKDICETKLNYWRGQFKNISKDGIEFLRRCLDK